MDRSGSLIMSNTSQVLSITFEIDCQAVGFFGLYMAFSLFVNLPYLPL